MLKLALAAAVLLAGCQTAPPVNPYPQLFLGRSIPCHYDPYIRIDVKVEWDWNWTGTAYSDHEVMYYTVPKCADECPEEPLPMQPEEIHYFSPWR